MITAEDKLKNCRDVQPHRWSEDCKIKRDTIFNLIRLAKMKEWYYPVLARTEGKRVHSHTPLLEVDRSTTFLESCMVIAINIKHTQTRSGIPVFGLNPTEMLVQEAKGKCKRLSMANLICKSKPVKQYKCLSVSNELGQLFTFNNGIQWNEIRACTHTRVRAHTQIGLGECTPNCYKSLYAWGWRYLHCFTTSVV